MNRQRQGTALTIDERKRARRLVITELVLGAITGQMSGGIILTTFVTGLGGGASEVGWLWALVYFGSAFQFLGSYVINRTGQRKWICIGCRAFSRTMWLCIAFLVLPGADAFLRRIFPAWLNPVWFLIIANGLNSLAGNISGIAWASWVADLAPRSFYGRYFGRAHMIANMLATPLGIAGGFLATLWQKEVSPFGTGSKIGGWFAGTPWEMGGYGIIAFFGAWCGLLGLLALARVPAIPYHAPGAQPPFFKTVREALHDNGFLRLLMARCWMSFWVPLAFPMWQFYSTDKHYLNIPMFIVKIWEGISGFSNGHGNRIAGKLGDRYGYRPIAIVWTLGMGTIPMWWFFAGPPPLWCWIASGAYIVGSWSWAGVNLCATNLVLKQAPREFNSTYVAFFQTANSLLGGIGTIVGKSVVERFKETPSALIPFGPLQLNPFQLVFLLSACGRWASMFWLMRLREPDALNVPTLVRALRGKAVKRPMAVGKEAVETA